MTLLFAAAVRGLIAFALPVLPSCAEPAASQETRPVADLRFRIVPRATEWLQGADVVVDLELDNHGPETVSVIHPMMNGERQPLFRLKRPGGDVATFAFGERWPDGKPSVKISLAKGQGWRGDLNVAGAADMTQPGVYELSAELNHGGMRAEAAPVKLEVQPARFRRVAVTLGRDDSGLCDVEGAALQVGKGKLEAYGAIFRETHAAIGEATILNLIPRGDLPLDTVDIAAAYSNVVGMKHLERWVAGASSRSVVVVESTSKSTYKIASPSPIKQLLTPLAYGSSRLSVLALVDRGTETELAAATLDAPEGGRYEATLQRLAAFESAAGAASTLAPMKLGGAAVVAVAQRRGESTSFELYQWDRAKSFERVGTADVEAWIPQGPCCVVVRSDGLVRASALVAKPGAGGETFAIATVEFKPGERVASKTLVTPGIPVEGGLLDARICWFEAQPGALSGVALLRPARGAPAIVIDLKSGSSRPPAQSIQARSQVALIPGQSAWYAAVLTAQSIDIRLL